MSGDRPDWLPKLYGIDGDGGLYQREPHPLGREVIPGGRPGEGPRTIAVAIGEAEAYPVRCPRCTDAFVRQVAMETPALLAVDEDGTASCPVCGLSMPELLAPVDEPW